MTIKVNIKAETLKQGVINLIDHASLDYKEWSKLINYKLAYDNSKLDEQTETFKNNFEVIEGKKYIKVINQGVFCFVVINDFEKNGKTFKKGDILKPANWNTPALNSPRGNVLNGEYPIEWTGPQYLR